MDLLAVTSLKPNIDGEFSGNLELSRRSISFGELIRYATVYKSYNYADCEY